MHALPLLTTSEAPAYTGHTHQLTPDQPGANLSSGQMGVHSQIAPTTATAVPISWKEVWPGGSGGVCPSDQFLRFLMTPQDAVNSRPSVGVANPLNATPLTWPNSSSLYFKLPSMDSELYDWYKLHKRHLSPPNKGNSLDTGSSSSYKSLPPICPTPHTCMCNHTYQEKSAALCRAGVNVWEPPFKARVESPQAEDLGYHYGGTFHWDPLINSSSPHNESSVAGALTFIVRYLTPHWVA